VIALDTETTGLSPYHGDRIFALGYFTNMGEYGFMDWDEKTREWMSRLLGDSSKTLIFHNAKFDLKMLGSEGLDIFESKAHVDCTLIMSRIFRENGSHKLRDLGVKYLKRDAEDKDEIEEYITGLKRKRFRKTHGRDPNFSDAPREMVKRRCLWDVETGLLLWYFLNERLSPEELELYKKENKLMYAVIDMENTGYRVDITRAKELRGEAERDSQEILDHLNSLVCPLEGIKRGKTQNETADVFNPGSSAEMEAAFRKLGYELKYKTEKGGWAFDEYAMLRYVSPPLQKIIRGASEESWKGSRYLHEVLKTIEDEELDPGEALPPLVLKCRELSKMVSTYYNSIIDKAVDRKTIRGREYGTLHCSFNQSGTRTGRFSSSQPNLQNIPRIMGPRECFVTRPGLWNFHFDYQQVEMRLLVHFTKDRKMADAIEKDIHRAVAAEVYDIPEDKVQSEQRKRAKGVNFGVIYGAGGPKIAYSLTKKGLPTSPMEGKELVAKYKQRFPSFLRLSGELKRQLARHGYVANPLGRRYHVDKDKSYILVNCLCQGTSADIIKDAIVKIWSFLRENGYRSKIISTIHDEIVLQVPQRERKTVPSKVVEMMEDHERWFVPLLVDTEVSKKRWSCKTHFKMKT
jgi:DNA polymerase I-like protein with 3'-5' exonuclease and polymerase domains